MIPPLAQICGEENVTWRISRQSAGQNEVLNKLLKPTITKQYPAMIVDIENCKK